MNNYWLDSEDWELLIYDVLGVDFVLEWYGYWWVVKFLLEWEFIVWGLLVVLEG